MRIWCNAPYHVFPMQRLYHHQQDRHHVVYLLRHCLSYILIVYDSHWPAHSESADDRSSKECSPTTTPNRVIIQGVITRAISYYRLRWRIVVRMVVLIGVITISLRVRHIRTLRTNVIWITRQQSFRLIRTKLLVLTSGQVSTYLRHFRPN